MSQQNKAQTYCDKCFEEHSPQFCPERPSPEINRKINCKHNTNHNCFVDINYIQDKEAYMADIKIFCAECGMPFEFVGVEAGMLFTKPMASADAQTLRAPIKPKGSSVLPAIPGFTIRAQ